MELRLNVNPPIIPTTAPIQTPSQTSVPAPGSKEAKLQQASEDFAGYLFAQMFSEMRPKPDAEDSLFGGEQDTEMFMDMFDMNIGQKYAANGNPVAEQLYQQLKGRQSPGSQS